jgi:hypothetical protein
MRGKVIYAPQRHLYAASSMQGSVIYGGGVSYVGQLACSRFCCVTGIYANTVIYGVTSPMGYAPAGPLRSLVSPPPRGMQFAL